MGEAVKWWGWLIFTAVVGGAIIASIKGIERTIEFEKEYLRQTAGWKGQ